MIHVKEDVNGYKVSVSGSAKQLIDETSGVIEELIKHVYNEFSSNGDNKSAREVAKIEFATIVGMSVERIKESLGFDILGDDEEEVVKEKPNPFTMGMSGDALTQFLMGMRGEEF